ncbi:hypothetical protein ABLI39_07220 [Pseudarthrobacter sp. B907]|uniref:hypothetical protein n=1 Tax=Pseudarthrobacter sp. B907 TaxID=3158261 RepID=UPI0032D9EAC4
MFNLVPHARELERRRRSAVLRGAETHPEQQRVPGLGELVLPVAGPDLGRDVFQLGPDPADVAARLPDGDDGVAPAAVGIGLVLEERPADTVCFAFHGVQLAHDGV